MDDVYKSHYSCTTMLLGATEALNLILAFIVLVPSLTSKPSYGWDAPRGRQWRRTVCPISSSLQHLGPISQLFTGERGQLLISVYFTLRIKRMHARFVRI